jgi:hypothetical protein
MIGGKELGVGPFLRQWRSPYDGRGGSQSGSGGGPTRGVVLFGEGGRRRKECNGSVAFGTYYVDWWEGNSVKRLF